MAFSLGVPERSNAGASRGELLRRAAAGAAGGGVNDGLEIDGPRATERRPSIANLSEARVDRPQREGARIERAVELVPGERRRHAGPGGSAGAVRRR